VCLRNGRSALLVDPTRPCEFRTYIALKVHFSATLGEEPEVKMGLV
jgi:hypothetical protein